MGNHSRTKKRTQQHDQHEIYCCHLFTILLGSPTLAEQVLHQKLRNLDIVPDLTMISSEHFLKASLEASQDPNCRKEMNQIIDHDEVDIVNRECAMKEKSTAHDDVDMIFTVDFTSCALSTFKYQSMCTSAGGQPGSLPSYKFDCKVKGHENRAKVAVEGLEVPYCIGQSCDAVTEYNEFIIREVENELNNFVQKRLHSEGMEASCAVGINSSENESESEPSPASVAALHAIPLMGGLLFLLAHVLE